MTQRLIAHAVFYILRHVARSLPHCLADVGAEAQLLYPSFNALEALFNGAQPDHVAGASGGELVAQQPKATVLCTFAMLGKRTKTYPEFDGIGTKSLTSSFISCVLKVKPGASPDVRRKKQMDVSLRIEAINSERSGK